MNPLIQKGFVEAGLFLPAAVGMPDAARAEKQGTGCPVPRFCDMLKKGKTEKENQQR